MEKKKKNSKKVNPIPKGMRTVTPYLLTDDAEGLIKFMKSAFGGELTYSMKADGKIMHATVKIGDSIVMTADAPAPYNPMPCQLYLYIEDVDAV